VSAFIIRRGQSVRWRMTMLAAQSPANMTGGTWGVQESQLKTENWPTFENAGTEAWLIFSPAQTNNMTTGRKKLRLKFTQANGDVKVFPDLMLTVQ
jgi:hypothetical protein